MLFVVLHFIKGRSEEEEKQKLREEIKEEIKSEMKPPLVSANIISAEENLPETVVRNVIDDSNKELECEKESLLSFIKNNFRVGYMIGDRESQLKFIEKVESYDLYAFGTNEAMEFLNNTRSEYLKFAAPIFLSLTALVLLGGLD
jgi:hypothetical protein